MTIPQLNEALNTYDIAFSKLKDAQSPLSEEQVLAVLNARDVVQIALKEENQASPDHQKKLIELDGLLKKQAGQITKVIDLSKWRASLEPSETAWWWKLETEVPPHPLDRWDWLWRALNIIGWTCNLGLLADLVPRFMMGGSGFAGAAAIAFPSILSLLQARSELTQAGKEGFDKLLNRLNIPPHFHEEAKLGSTGLLLLILLSFRSFLPTLCDFYQREGFKNYNQGQIASAEAKYLQSLALNPDNVKSNYSLGVIYEDLQQFDKAETQYQLAVKGDFVKAYNNLGHLYILNEKSSLAVPLLLEGLTKVEDSQIGVRYALLKNLGWALLKEDREEEAEEFLLSAIQLASSSQGIEEINNRGSAHCLLAQVYQKQKGKEEEALSQWQECCQFGSMFNPDEDKWLSLAHKELKKAGKQQCGLKNGEL